MDGLVTIMKKMYNKAELSIYKYRKFCFVLVMLYLSCIRKIPVAIESVAFSFSVICSLNNTLSL